MQGHLYRIHTRRDLQKLQQRLADCLALTYEKWLPTTTPACEVSEAWNAHERGGDTAREPLMVVKGIALMASPDFLLHLYDAMTQDRHHKATHASASEIPSALATTLLRDLLANLAVEKSKITDPAPPAYKGSGSVWVTIRMSAGSFQMLLPQLAVANLIGKPTPPAGKVALAMRNDGIGQGKVRLRVSLGETELRVADLADLALGHVLRLNLNVDQAFQLTNAHTGQRLCDTYLGQSAGKKAIQLTR